MEIPETKNEMNGRKIRLPPRRGAVKAAIFKKLLKSAVSVVMMIGDLGKKIGRNGNCFGPKLISPAEALVDSPPSESYKLA